MECQLSFYHHLNSSENWNRLRKYVVKNDVAASTSKGTKNTTIPKVAKSPVVLKSTKASSKGSSIKKTGARWRKKTDR